MSDTELAKLLRKQAVLDNLRCLGCGYEHSCSIRGCAIINKAADRLEELLAENTWNPATQPPPFGVRVIVCRKDGKVEQGNYDINGWWHVYGTRTKNVQMWRPMPAPPGRDANEKA